MAKQHVSRNLAFQAAKIIKTRHAADAEGRASDRDILDERLSALAVESSFHAIDFPEAAVHQASLMISDAENMPGLSESDRDLLLRRTVNLLRFIEDTTGVWRTDLGFEFYAPPKCDGEPFAQQT